MCYIIPYFLDFVKEMWYNVANRRTVEQSLKGGRVRRATLKDPAIIKRSGGNAQLTFISHTFATNTSFGVRGRYGSTKEI
jgi:hypothetical protein